MLNKTNLAIFRNNKYKSKTLRNFMTVIPEKVNIS